MPRIDIADFQSGVSLCVLRGAFNVRAGVDLLERSLNTLLERGRRVLCMDCSAVSGAGSRAMALLISRHTWLSERGGALWLVAAPKFLRDQLRLLGADRVMHAAPSLAEALIAIAATPRLESADDDGDDEIEFVGDNEDMLLQGRAAAWSDDENPRARPLTKPDPDEDEFVPDDDDLASSADSGLYRVYKLLGDAPPPANSPQAALDAPGESAHHRGPAEGSPGSAEAPRVTFACPACGKSGQAPASLAGRRLRCRCGAQFAVPAH